MCNSIPLLLELQVWFLKIVQGEHWGCRLGLCIIILSKISFLLKNLQDMFNSAFVFSFTWPWLQSLVLVLHSFFSFHFSCLDAMFGSLRLRRAKTSVSGTFLLFWFQTKPFFRKVKNHPRKRKSQQQLKSQLVCEMRPKVLCEVAIECPPVIFSYILQPECGLAKSVKHYKACMRIQSFLFDITGAAASVVQILVKFGRHTYSKKSNFP